MSARTVPNNKLRAYTENAGGLGLGGEAVVLTTFDAEPTLTGENGKPLIPTGLWVGTSGNIVAGLADGTKVTLLNVPAGYLPLPIRKVYKASTTAADMTFVYGAGPRAGDEPGQFLDVAALNLTGWFKDFISAPWVGRASAGTSGSRTLQTTGANPTVGTEVQLHPPAVFNNGATLADAVATTGDYIATAGYRVIVLVNNGVNAAATGTFSNDANILGDFAGTYWGIAATLNEVTVWQWNGISYGTATAAMTSGWHVIDVSLFGSVMTLYVDGVLQATTATAGPSNVTSNLYMGNGGTNKYVGSVFEVLTSKVSLDFATPKAFVRYFNARYGLSL